MKIFKLLPLLLLIIMTIQSCAVVSLRGHQAKLSKNSNYQGADLAITTPFDKFNFEFYVGAGNLDINKSDLPYDEDIKKELNNWTYSIGLGGTYYFTKKRLQPYVSLELLTFPLGSEDDKKKNEESGYKILKGYYRTMTPKTGVRFYLTNRIALNAALGYQMGLLKINDVSSKIKGLEPSVGLTFVLAKKIDK